MIVVDSVRLGCGILRQPNRHHVVPAQPRPPPRPFPQCTGASRRPITRQWRTSVSTRTQSRRRFVHVDRCRCTHRPLGSFSRSSLVISSSCISSRHTQHQHGRCQQLSLSVPMTCVEAKCNSACTNDLHSLNVTLSMPMTYVA